LKPTFELKDLVFLSVDNWENSNAAFILFWGPNGVNMLNIHPKNETTLYSLISTEHAADFISDDHLLDLLFKDF
jgi:hypothetical protein